MLVRVDYGPNSQARFDQLVYDLDDAVDAVLGDKGSLIDDEQHCSIDGELLPALYAVLPYLLEPKCVYYAASEERFPFDSELLQNELYLADLPEVPEEDRRVVQLTNCFMADNEAMITGLLLWLRVDEFGTPVLQERIRPSSVQEVVAVGCKRDLQEWRESVPWLR